MPEAQAPIQDASMEPSELRTRMLAGVGARTYDLDVTGASTRVIEAGDGPPLVLQHGAIECGGIMWTPVIAELARRHRVVVPDAPGLGESEPVDRLDIDAFERWFDAFLDRAHLERPALAAHSLFGSMAARYAARGSDRLGRLVIYGAPGVGPYHLPWRLRYVAIRFGVRPTPRNAERFDRFALLDLEATRRRDPEWYRAFATYNLAQARRRQVKKTMNRLIADQIKPIGAAALSGISVPVALLWGRHDRMVPLAVGEAAARDHGWPLHVIDDAAHAPHIEAPESFVSTLTRLLDDHPSARTASS
jgi:pimeloyl-ACP methyl ester carboxylesterase